MGHYAEAERRLAVTGLNNNTAMVSHHLICMRDTVPHFTSIIQCDLMMSDG